MKKLILLAIVLQICIPLCYAEKHPKLPWWSDAAPTILKQLDFSKVSGDAELYNLNNNYQLTKMERQGRWGKIYLLEKTNFGLYTKTICVVKVLSPRPNRRISTYEFRLRHWEEIINTTLIANWNIAVKPYAIMQNDQDHFLLFFEYAQNARDKLERQDLNTTLLQLSELVKDIKNMHKRGYAHGDIKLDNVLTIGNKLKLCDWFSLTNTNQIKADQCHCLAANLPQRSSHATYFEKALNAKLQYSIVTISNGRQIYWLHPITADRISLAISLLKYIAPDQYEKIKQTPKNFYLYSPLGLTYWPKHKTLLRNVRAEVIIIFKNMQDKQSLKAELLAQAIELLNIEHVILLGLSF